MVLVTGSWKLWAVGMAVSLGIFLVLYFTVISPDNKAANQALQNGLQQTQQVLNQTKKQLGSAGQAGSTARKEISKAQRLTACVQAAGTDPSKLASCQTQFCQ